MIELIERLRADAELIHNNGITRKLRRHRVAALLREAADALAAAQQRIACLPAEWHEDSSLETWFPFTAKQLAALQAENERLRAERDALLDALRQIAEWPDGGNRYGQENIKRFARHTIDAALSPAPEPRSTHDAEEDNSFGISPSP